MSSDQVLKVTAGPRASRLTALPVEVLQNIAAFVCIPHNIVQFRFEYKADKTHSFMGLRTSTISAEHAKSSALSHNHYFTGIFPWLCHEIGQVWQYVSTF